MILQITSILFLIYFYWNRSIFILFGNSIIDIITTIPSILSFSLIIMFMLVSIITKKFKVASYIMAVTIIIVGIIIQSNIFLLNDITDLILCKVYHSISLDVKIKYFLSCINKILSFYEEIISNKVNYELFLIHVQDSYNHMDKTILQNYNAQQIESVANSLVHKEYLKVTSRYYFTIMLVALMIGMSISY